MKQELLPSYQGYKANLHSHTVHSDGALTAQEMKDLYKAHGYSILAYTDHAFMGDRTEYNDKDFVALNGYENHVEPFRDEKFRSVKSYHMNFYSPVPDKVAMVGITDYYYEFVTHYNKEAPRRKDELPYGFCFGAEGFSIGNINKFIKQANDEGYLVVNNHPVWSRLTDTDYTALEGLTGTEIFNYGSYMGGYEEDDGYIYDQMLRAGQRVYCFANDDNHNHPNLKDAFGGYNIMYPEKLDYESVFDCMKTGKFYASSGAEICGLYADGDDIFVGTKDAVYVRIVTSHRAMIKWAEEGATIDDASFTLNDKDDYFRIVVKNKQGKKAYSRAYFRGVDGKWL